MLTSAGLVSVVRTSLSVSAITVEEMERDAFLRTCVRDRDDVSKVTFAKWFAYLDNAHFSYKSRTSKIVPTAFDWLVPSRDQLYSLDGLQFVVERFLHPREPIQYGMLRIAFLCAHEERGAIYNPREIRALYELFSLNLLQLAPNLASGVRDISDEPAVQGVLYGVSASPPQRSKAVTTTEAVS